MNCKNFEPQKIPVTCIRYFHELACCGFNWHTPLCSSYFLFQTNFTSSKCSFCITGTDVKFDLPKFPLDSPNVLRESLNNRPQLAAVPIPLNPGRGVSLAEDLRTQTDYDEVDRSCSDQKEEMTQWTSFQWLATSILILNDQFNHWSQCYLVIPSEEQTPVALYGQ